MTSIKKSADSKSLENLCDLNEYRAHQLDLRKDTHKVQEGKGLNQISSFNNSMFHLIV